MTVFSFYLHFTEKISDDSAFVMLVSFSFAIGKQFVHLVGPLVLCVLERGYLLIADIVTSPIQPDLRYV